MGSAGFTFCCPTPDRNADREVERLAANAKVDVDVASAFEVHMSFECWNA